MKTTLNIDAGVMAQIKQEAARQGCTMSELFETALRQLLQPRRAPRALEPLPTFHGGGTQVNVANREALYDRMEEG
jgi:hypothetical protein